MGCDIHCHVEVKINGEWHHYNHPTLSRNYQLFSKMAGVRGNEKPIAEPRGMPEDSTFMTKFDNNNWDGDGHTHSWLSDHEVAQIVDWVNEEERRKGWYSFEYEELGYIFSSGWNFRKYPSKHNKGFDGTPDGFEAARLIFWFDN